MSQKDSGFFASGRDNGSGGDRPRSVTKAVGKPEPTPKRKDRQSKKQKRRKRK